MKKILIFLLSLIVLSEVKGQVVVPPGYSGRNTRENLLASAMNALNIPAGDSAQLKIGQWKRAGAVYVDTSGASKGYYYYMDGLFYRILDLRDTSLLISTKHYVDSLFATVPAGEGSTVRTIPYTAFKNQTNPTLKEANTYVVSTYGSDSLGFFNGFPQYMIPNEVRQIVTDMQLYNAFPTIHRSPVTGTMIIFFQRGAGHASITVPCYIRSIDGGKSWSQPDTLERRRNGGNFPNGAAICRKDGVWFMLYDNGVNTLGLSFVSSRVKMSTDDGVTFTTIDTIDGAPIFGYRMTTQTYNILQPSSDTSDFLTPVYGLDAAGTNFEAGILKSNTTFSSWTYYPLPQDSSVDKFNESALYETEDSIFAITRSEKVSAPFFYRTEWNNTTNTWGTPVAITFNGTPPPYKTMPSVTVLPDGRIMLVIRTNAASLKGAIWISEDNGLSYTYSGPLYSDSAPFMYSGGLVFDNTVYIVYATEAGTVPFTSTRAGINLATFSANPSFLFYKDITSASIINAQNQPHSISDNFKAFTATKDAIRGPIKPTGIYIDSVVTKQGVLSGQDIAVYNPSNSLVLGINHTGHHSSTWSPSPLKGAVSFSNSIGRIDSSIRIAGHVGVGIKARDGNWYFAPHDATGGNFTIVNPFTKDTTLIAAASGNTYIGAAVYEDSVYFMPTNSTTMKIINIRDHSVIDYTLPSIGWYGLNIAGGKIRSSKTSVSNQIFQFDCKTRSHELLTTPNSGSWTTGPSDGRYQWYLPYASSYLLKQDLITNEIVEYGQNIVPLVGTGLKTQGIFIGTKMYISNSLSNVIWWINTVTGERNFITLPGAGGYSGITGDGVSVYSIPLTGDSLYKIDPKTDRFVGFKIGSDTATNKSIGGFMDGHKVVITPYESGVVNVFEPDEFGPDPSQVLWDNVDAVKLNIADTTGKWISDIYRKAGTDSVFTKKNGVSSFAFIDSTSAFTIAGTPVSGDFPFWNGANPAWNSGLRALNATTFIIVSTGDTLSTLQDIRDAGGFGGGSSYTFTSPLVNTADTVDLAGLTGLGTANQMLGMNSGATGYEYKTFVPGSAGSDFTIDHTANTVTVNIPSMTSAGVTRGLLTNVSQVIPGTKTWLAAGFFNAGLLTAASSALSNFTAFGGSVPTSLSTTAGYLVRGATGTFARFSSLGTSTATMTANYNYGGLSIGQMPVTEAATGTHPLISALIIRAPLITAGSATVENTATVYIEGPPLTTTTDPVKSLWVDAGLTQLDSLQVGANVRFTGLTDNAATADSFTVVEDGVLHTRLLPEVSAAAQPDSLSSGQYVPTLANVANVAGTTAVPVNYKRVGSYVTVSGHASCTVTTGGGTFTTMSMTLPFASNFVNVSDCAAPASAQTSSAITAGYVSTNTTTDVAELNFYSGTGSHNIYFTFTYKIR